MAGFTKLFGSIINSTIWREDDKTRLVWITMLAMCDRNGVIESSLPGLADAARVTISECEAALVRLQSPDAYSRTKEHEGRRIEQVDGGWLVLNYTKYREKMSADQQRERARVRQERFRKRKAPLTLRAKIKQAVADDDITRADQATLRKQRNGNHTQQPPSKATREYDLDAAGQADAGNTAPAGPEIT